MRLKVSSAPGLSWSVLVLTVPTFPAGCLPKELGDLINLKFFDVLYNSIGGQLSIRTERLRTLLTVYFLSGELPKELPVSLEVLDVSGAPWGPHKFTGGIPSEWGTLTNLKELKMAYCGLGGKLLSTRTERLQISC